MKSWAASIRESAELAVYAGELAGAWAHIVKASVSEFNTLAKAHRLGVRMKLTKDADAAAVTVQTADGAITASHGGESRTADFKGSLLHGRTFLFSRQPADTLEKASIYLPSQPQVNTPSGLRSVGPGVMKLIAVHELFHACGLENSDHSSDDLFQANPRVDSGDSPAGDKVLIGAGPRKMPPLYLGGETARKVKGLWSG